MSNPIENLGKALRSNYPKKKATLHLGDQVLSSGSVQVLPDRVIFRPAIPTPPPQIQRQPVRLTVLDKSEDMFLQVDSDTEQTEKIWHFLYLNP